MNDPGRGLARLQRKQSRDVVVRGVLIAVATAVVVGSGFFASSYFGLIRIDGITPPDEFRSSVSPPVAVPGPTPRSAIMSHVLFIDSRRSMADAVARADALQGGLPNLLFFVTPLDVHGTRHFELYVGPAYSAVEATTLKGPVAGAMRRENPDDWRVRDRQYSFYFGEYESTVNAQGGVEALARASIPAYSLQVAYTDGTTRVLVYGGAFRDEVEAEKMGRMVSNADIGEMVLTRRRGTVLGDY
jgi:hypothetical protein